jgi:hypothetical protein
MRAIKVSANIKEFPMRETSGHWVIHQVKEVSHERNTVKIYLYILYFSHWGKPTSCFNTRTPIQLKALKTPEDFVQQS